MNRGTVDLAVIELAQAADEPAIAALLHEARLPSEDILPHLNSFLVARDATGGTVIGAVGAELGGADALLRSLVVGSQARGSGLGTRLCDALDRAAEQWGVTRWWLLTTTAAPFFLRRGFKLTSRGAAPAAIAATSQFSGTCPAAALCLSGRRKAEA